MLQETFEINIAENSNKVQTRRINELLNTAREALVEAGCIAEQYDIDFTFNLNLEF